MRLLIVKIIRYLLSKLGRGGSLPGVIALKMDSQILKKFKMPDKVIVVTGTNGKTTTSNLIVESFAKAAYKVIGNRKGDNLKEGIVTLLCTHSNLKYEVQADVVVLEVDELTVMRVFEDLHVTTFVVNNFFRDQLDRAGEMETIVRRIESVVKDFEGHLVLNANDPNVVRLKDSASKAKVHFYGVSQNEVSKEISNEASEGKFCPRCGKPLHYDYYQYSHIGKFVCDCGFGKNEIECNVDEIDYNQQTFTMNGQVYHSFQNAIYAIYNCAAVLCCMKVNGVDGKYANDVFMSFTMNIGRNEMFDLNGPCLLNLIKNPTGANEVMKAIMKNQNDKNVMIVLNDFDQDGRDVSWIWDAHFDLLIDDHTKRILCSGSRAYDMALRLKYEGYENIEVFENVEEGILRLKELSEDAYVISTYTALQSTRAIIKRYAA
ncbi:MAG: MurT ligase domain-containing protein [Traorella sp.]